MSTEGKVFLTFIFAFAIWLFVGLPLISLPLARLGELPQKAPLVTPLAASCAAIIAGAAFLVALRQLDLNRSNQRETTGKTIFRDFLKLCVEQPEFAYERQRDGFPSTRARPREPVQDAVGNHPNRRVAADCWDRRAKVVQGQKSSKCKLRRKLSGVIT
jgi:hypothetical protein